jgi:uncharacterized protein (TIGR02246 family)
MNRIFFILLVIASLFVYRAVARGDELLDKEDAAIRATGEAYVKAFNSHDAEAVAGFWSPDAVYANRLTQERVVGREAIAAQFTSIFQATGDLKLDVRVESIQFVSPNVAVERGVAKFLSPQSEPEASDYSAVYVRRDSKWLLDRVTDDPKPVVQSQYKHLNQLEWMIGSWVDEDDNARIATDCSWTKNKNFITRSFTVSIGDRIELSGMQIIGWDPAAKQIRSWTFDSDGGFSEGSWSKTGNRWYVRKKGTTADGRTAAAVNIITFVDDNAFKLQATQRTLAGELLPNIDEVLVVRR